MPLPGGFSRASSVIPMAAATQKRKIDPTGPLGPPIDPPVNTVAPVASGNVYNGVNLFTTNGTWDNSPDSYSYQWKRDGVDIGSATNQVYTVVAADEGKQITCSVTATNAGGSSSAASNALWNWVPSQLSPLVWLDVASTENVSKSGSSITQINDKSGFGRNAVFAATRQPVWLSAFSNGLPVAGFDGVNDRGDLDFGADLSAFTLAIFVRPTRQRRFDAFVDGTSGTGRLTAEVGGGNNTIEFFVTNVGAAAQSSGTWSLGQFYDLVFKNDGATLSTFINTSGSGSAASANRTLFKLSSVMGDRGTGGFFYTSGYMAELIIAPPNVGTTGIAALHTYRTTKWGSP